MSTAVEYALLVFSLGTLFGYLVSTAHHTIDKVGLLTSREKGASGMNLSDSFIGGFTDALAKHGLTADADALAHIRGRIESAAREGILERHAVRPRDANATSRGAGIAFAALVRHEAEASASSTVSFGLIRSILDRLCPGFFPIC